MIGKLSDERYSRVAVEYEAEQKELLKKVKENEKQLSEMEQKSVDMRLLLQGLREFTDMRELTPTIVNKLIQRIEVHNPEKKYAQKSVKVAIYFTSSGISQSTGRAGNSEDDRTDTQHTATTQTTYCIKRWCNPIFVGLHHLSTFYCLIRTGLFLPSVFYLLVYASYCNSVFQRPCRLQ